MTELSRQIFDQEPVFRPFVVVVAELGDRIRMASMRPNIFSHTSGISGAMHFAGRETATSRPQRHKWRLESQAPLIQLDMTSAAASPNRDIAILSVSHIE